MASSASDGSPSSALGPSRWRRAGAALVLAVVVGVAGCSGEGPPPAEPGPRSAEHGRTPAPTPVESATASGDRPASTPTSAPTSSATAEPSPAEDTPSEDDERARARRDAGGARGTPAPKTGGTATRAPTAAPEPDPEPEPEPSPAADPAAQVEARLLELLNAARADAGLAAVSRDPRLDVVARTWSADLAASGADLAHNPDFAGQYPSGWRAAGENVAWTSDGRLGAPEVAGRMHEAWMDSEGHRANILGDYTHVGLGVALSADHGWYLTQNFASF